MELRSQLQDLILNQLIGSSLKNVQIAIPFSLSSNVEATAAPQSFFRPLDPPVCIRAAQVVRLRPLPGHGLQIKQRLLVNTFYFRLACNLFSEMLNQHFVSFCLLGCLGGFEVLV